MSDLKEFDLPNFKNSTFRLDRPSKYLLTKARRDHFNGYTNLQKSMKSSTIYIGKLSFNTTEEQLFEIFSKCGTIKKIIMGLDKLKLTPTGFCFIIFDQPKGALNAVKFLNKTKVNGNPMEIDLDPGFEEGRQFGRGSDGAQRQSLRDFGNGNNRGYNQRGGRGGGRGGYGGRGGRGGRGGFGDRGGRGGGRGGRGGNGGGRHFRERNGGGPNRYAAGGQYNNGPQNPGYAPAHQQYFDPDSQPQPAVYTPPQQMYSSGRGAGYAGGNYPQESYGSRYGGEQGGQAPGYIRERGAGGYDYPPRDNERGGYGYNYNSREVDQGYEGGGAGQAAYGSGARYGYESRPDREYGQGQPEAQLQDRGQEPQGGDYYVPDDVRRDREDPSPNDLPPHMMDKDLPPHMQ
ncbi:hypothetical protein CANARDRAFT_26899 [[Candida] arabinofermentans NRRL YB-2248]|uniref:RRM domain-containing protein n=1 Tax=[Candida] arabinofermentans NRRL YB-2248 TaxID=983967 RepID=A0A1E4T6U8_9ASCO|nr:hypothetical protein CANARDRAFT_26899 [[Candida] arabinofermentans NRRL YB-2248]